MKLIASAVLAASALGLALPAFAQNASGTNGTASVTAYQGGAYYMPNEVLVRFAPDVTDGQLANAFQKASLNLVEHIQTGPMEHAGRLGVTRTDESGFRIERRAPNAVDFTWLKNTAAGATSFADSGLSSGASYEYRVRAFNSTTGGYTLWASTSATAK
jgi:hypothetical protein